MPFTERLSEALAVVGLIPPSNHTNNTDNSIAGIDASRFKRLLAIPLVGVLGTNANVQGYWIASATANMASPTNVAASIPMTLDTANRVSMLEVRSDQLPANTRYVAPVFIVNAAASFFGAVILGGEAAYKPASAFDLANTVEERDVT